MKTLPCLPSEDLFPSSCRHVPKARHLAEAEVNIFPARSRPLEANRAGGQVLPGRTCAKWLPTTLLASTALSFTEESSDSYSCLLISFTQS